MINLTRINKISKQLRNNKFFKVAVFIFIFYFTFVLRAHNYDRVPSPNHLDEMLYAWSGIYLIETGSPVSWSTLDYPKRAEVYKGKISYKSGEPSASVTLYKPWLDEPPLFSLIVGYFAHINGALRTDFIPSSYIRIPTVLMAAITSIFIFLVAKVVSGYWIAILSMLIYGTVPLIVFATRSAMPENFIALLLTVMIYLFLKFKHNLKFYYLLPVPLLIGLAGLSKPTGYFMLPLALYLVFAISYYNQRLKDGMKAAIYFILGTLPFLGLYFWYGLALDPEIFWRITSIQSGRPAGFASLMWYFISPSYDTAIFKDSWYFFCLMAASFFVLKARLGFKKVTEFSEGQQMIILVFVYWVIVVMISGGENDLLGWYRFPTLPFLSILGAWGLQYIYKKADFFASFISAGFLLGSRSLLVNAFHPNVEPMQYRAIFSGLLLPSLINSIFNIQFLQNLSKIIILGIIILGMYFNIFFIYNAFELNCQSKSCPIVPSTLLSEMHFPLISKFLQLR